MNPFTWLLAKLRPNPTPSAPTPSPVSPPLTEAERTARQQQREQAFERAMVQDFNQAIRQGRGLSDALPPEALKALHLLRHNQADQELASQWGDWAEQLRLATEAQALEAAAKYHSWCHSLCRDFGQAIGTKLSQHRIEPGMTLEMVLASFGTPSQVQDVTAGNPELYTLRYGSPETGSVIELHQGVVTRATVGKVAFPEHVYDLPDIHSC
jgi:hypothetical protein